MVHSSSPSFIDDANHQFTDEDYEEDLDFDTANPQAQLADPRQEVMLTPTLSSPTRTITFRTPYGKADRNAEKSPVEEHDESRVLESLTPPTSKNGVAALVSQLPPSPEFPSPPATTLFLYYRAEKTSSRLPTLPRLDQPMQKLEVSQPDGKSRVKEESIDSASSGSSLDTTFLVNEKERLEREIEEAIRRGAEVSPASLPTTTTFHFGEPCFI